MANESSTKWGYPYVGSVWADADKGGNPLAESGKHQSPIDLPFTSNIQDAPINFMWQPQKKLTVKGFRDFGGHSLTFNVEKGSSVEVNNKVYDLVQFHFHTGSEHTVNGAQYAMEGHWVHSVRGKPVDLSEKGDLVVIGVFYEVGSEPNKGFSNLLKNISGEQKSEDLDVELDMASLVPPQKELVDGRYNYNVRYWTYKGSLTTPPLSEIVTWVVFMDVLPISQEQLVSVQALSGFTDNFRPTQPLHLRQLMPNDKDLDLDLEERIHTLRARLHRVAGNVTEVEDANKIIREKLDQQEDQEHQDELKALIGKIGDLNVMLSQKAEDLCGVEREDDKTNKPNKFLQCFGFGGKAEKINRT